ncbi:hypothetical protein D3C86_1925310 [compost metagenome]
MFLRQTQQRHWHADVVIQIAGSVKRIATLAEDRSRHLFDRGFAGRARQRHNARGDLLANPGSQLTKRLARVFHHQLRQIDVQFTAHQ